MITSKLQQNELLAECDGKPWSPNQKRNIWNAHELTGNDLSHTIDFGEDGSVTFVATGAGYIYAQFDDKDGNIYARYSFPHHYLFERYILKFYRNIDWSEIMWFPHYGESSLAHWRIMAQAHLRQAKSELPMELWF